MRFSSPLGRIEKGIPLWIWIWSHGLAKCCSAIKNRGENYVFHLFFQKYMWWYVVFRRNFKQWKLMLKTRLKLKFISIFYDGNNIVENIALFKASHKSNRQMWDMTTCQVSYWILMDYFITKQSGVVTMSLSL